MNANRWMKITAAVMTAAMLAAAVPAAASATSGSAVQQSVSFTVLQEVYGDPNGVYNDMGYTYSDGSYRIQNPLPIARSMNKWPFAFFLNYCSNNAYDNKLGNGMSSNYDQRLIKHDDSSYTYVDELGISHDFWYDTRTGQAYSPEADVQLVINPYRYELKFGNSFQGWFNPDDGLLSYYYVNNNVDDATKIYRDEDGLIREVLGKEYSHYRFSYETLADGSKRVSSIEYAESTGGTNLQIIRFSYDADGNLIDTVNISDPDLERGYTYTYAGGKLTSAFNKLYGGTMSVTFDAAGVPFILFQ